MQLELSKSKRVLSITDLHQCSNHIHKLHNKIYMSEVPMSFVVKLFEMRYL